MPGVLPLLAKQPARFVRRDPPGACEGACVGVGQREGSIEALRHGQGRVALQQLAPELIAD
jgi:hypothetical protein